VTAETYYGRDLPPDGYRSRRGRAGEDSGSRGGRDGERIRFTSKTIPGPRQQRARNWDLADYQVDELKELLEDIAKRVPDYKGAPVGNMIESTTMPPIGDVESAIKARDLAKFTAAFDKLTAACNVCHEAANRGFIVIQRPATSPFPNQSFAHAENRPAFAHRPSAGKCLSEGQTQARLPIWVQSRHTERVMNTSALPL
jgi:hypothetical protein